MQKITIEDMQRIAKKHGGQCLSKEYINAHFRLIWQCKEGHQWEATPNNIKQGGWCPACDDRQRKSSIKEMREIAEKRGGMCLSKEYINAKSKLKWQCEHGHQWEAVPNHIKRGRWCPICGGKKKSTIEEMREIARERGGQCLSEEYISTHSKIKWQCKVGHQWKSVPGNIKKGSWCPVCAGVQKGTIEEMREIAESRGGKCLSEKYINGYSKLKWQCEDGHRWEAVPDEIKRGSWCPVCV